MFIKLRKLKPRRRHRVAHRTAHRWEPCEICGVVEILRSQNVRDDEVVGKAGEGLARVGKALRSSGSRDGTDRGSHGGMRCVGGHLGGCRCARGCGRGFREGVSTTERNKLRADSISFGVLFGILSISNDIRTTLFI